MGGYVCISYVCVWSGEDILMLLDDGSADGKFHWCKVVLIYCH